MSRHYNHLVWEAAPGDWAYGVFAVDYYPSAPDGEAASEWDVEYSSTVFVFARRGFASRAVADDALRGWHGNSGHGDVVAEYTVEELNRMLVASRAPAYRFQVW